MSAKQSRAASAIDRPKAEVVHSLPGRMRLRLDARRGDEAFFDRVAHALGEVPGIHAVTARPFTGSLLVFHALDDAALLALCAELDLFDVLAAEAILEPFAVRVARGALDLDARIKSATGDRLDLTSTISGGLLVLAGVQTLRGQIMSPAITLAFQAASLMRGKF
ncbi:MAG: hypothetical protein HXY22_06555 [Alphaproteobacteria bacterium]|nr:hypothetical protein [Alphaproteobacteria bacterium]